MAAVADNVSSCREGKIRLKAIRRAAPTLMDSLFFKPAIHLAFLCRIGPCCLGHRASLRQRAGHMSAAFTSDDWQERKIREWLLLILRFAITREPRDRLAASAMADELDAVGGYWRPMAPRFFVTTAAEVCDAILGLGEQANAVLRTHIARISDPRLRDAFAAAVGLQHQPVDYHPQPPEAPCQSTIVNRQEALDLYRVPPKSEL